MGYEKGLEKGLENAKESSSGQESGPRSPTFGVWGLDADNDGYTSAEEIYKLVNDIADKECAEIIGELFVTFDKNHDGNIDAADKLLMAETDSEENKFYSKGLQEYCKFNKFYTLENPRYWRFDS